MRIKTQSKQSVQAKPPIVRKGGFNAGRAAVGAGAGFLLGGPLGAAAGAFLLGRNGPATPAAKPPAVQLPPPRPEIEEETVQVESEPEESYTAPLVEAELTTEDFEV